MTPLFFSCLVPSDFYSGGGGWVGSSAYRCAGSNSTPSHPHPLYNLRSGPHTGPSVTVPRPDSTVLLSPLPYAAKSRRHRKANVHYAPPPPPQPLHVHLYVPYSTMGRRSPEPLCSCDLAPEATVPRTSRPWPEKRPPQAIGAARSGPGAHVPTEGWGPRRGQGPCTGRAGRAWRGRRPLGSGTAGTSQTQ